MKRIRNIKVLLEKTIDHKLLEEAVMYRLGAEFPNLGDSDRASRAINETRNRASYRSDTFAELFSECQERLAEAVDPFRMNLRSSLVTDVVVGAMRGVVALANMKVRRRLLYGEENEITKLDPVRVECLIQNVPGASSGMVSNILAVVNVALMQKVYDEAKRKGLTVDGTEPLPGNRASDVLVAFTGESMPKPLRAAQCWCGYWLEAGVWQKEIWQCRLCGEPAPPPLRHPHSTLLWRLESCVVLNFSSLSPKILNALSQKGVQNRWRKLQGESIPDEDLVEDAPDEDLVEDEDIEEDEGLAENDDLKGEYDE